MKPILDKPKQEKLRPKKTGFSLVELLVASAMIVLITTISIISYRNGERSKRLQLAADGVINAIRMAQNYTLAGKILNTGCATNKSPVYYYVEFNYSNTYYIKARDKCSTDITVDTLKLVDKTQIKSSGLKFNGMAATTKLDVQFLPPFAKIFGSTDNNPYASFTTESIIIETSDSARSKTVTIDGISGEIGQ